jgi:hybrid polyketide synthase / nonribosomal peptide synthetase ACE1
MLTCCRTNAHVILSHYQPSRHIRAAIGAETKRYFGPFIFSAKSNTSLLGSLKQMSQFVCQDSSLDLDALSCVLQSRRTAFPLRTWIAAGDRESLVRSLDEKLRIAEANTDAQFAVRPTVQYADSHPQILGVFTGQVRTAMDFSINV